MKSTTKPKKLTVVAAAEHNRLPAVRGDNIPTVPDVCPGEQVTSDDPVKKNSVPISDGRRKTTDMVVHPNQLPAVPAADIPTVPSLCPGAQETPDEQVKRYAREIGDAWHDSIETILAVAKQCAAAKHSLDGFYVGQLLRKLRFSREMFSKLANLGKNKALSAAKVRKYLPASWTILYALRHLTEQELQLAISQRVLKPGATRSDLQKWVCEHSSHHKDDCARSAHMDALNEDKRRAGLGEVQINDAAQRIMDSWTESETRKLVRKAPEAARAIFFKKLKAGY